MEDTAMLAIEMKDLIATIAKMASEHPLKK
jgi:hypothetical protein